MINGCQRSLAKRRGRSHSRHIRRTRPRGAPELRREVRLPMSARRVADGRDALLQFVGGDNAWYQLVPENKRRCALDPERLSKSVAMVYRFDDGGILHVLFEF